MSSSQTRQAQRRGARVEHSSPYHRPTRAKKASSWFSGLIDFLNPLLGRKSESPDPSEQQDHEGDAPHGQPATTTLGAGAPTDPVYALPRFNPLPHPLVASGPPHPTNPSASDPLPPKPKKSTFAPPPKATTAQAQAGPSSPPKSREEILKFLNERTSTGLNAFEVEGLMSFLKKTESEEDAPEPFRFSTSPATPARGTTPAEGAPPRTLKRNPNGSYRYQGAGSARPRNRFQSPGFGSTRGTPVGIKLASPQKSPSTTKRRRVHDESPQRVPFPSSGPSVSPEKPATNGRAAPAPAQNGAQQPPAAPEQPKSNGMAPPPKPRLSRSPAPGPLVRPSPLRQTWSAGSDSETSPSATAPKPKPPHGPTRTANFLNELIKEVTPPQRPAAIVNPYQTASPVKPPQKKAAPKRRAAPRPAEKPAEPKEMEEMDLSTMSPQAGIELTVPKGAKRSRPPPDVGKRREPQTVAPAPGTPLRRSSRHKSPEPPATNGIAPNSGTAPKHSQMVEIEEVSDEDESPRAKKHRKGLPVSPTSPEFLPADGPIIEEIEDEDERAAQVAKQDATKAAEVVEPGARATSPRAEDKQAQGAAAAKGFAFVPKSSAPVRPSKLRFSYQADGDKEEKDDKPAPAPVPTPSFGGPFAFDTAFDGAPAAPPAYSSFSSFPPPPSTGANGATDATVNGTSAPTPKPTPNTDPKRAALSASVTSLPVYNFSFDTKPGESSTGAYKSRKASDSVKAAPAETLPSFAFAPALAGGFAPTGEGKGKGKAPAGESLGFGRPSQPRTASFDWAAAGMKAPSAAGDGWTCDACMCKNPASATDKCTVCEGPAPASASKAAPTASFNWAAAGMKAPTSAGDQWTCGTCMCKNAASVDQCSVCEASR